MWAWANLFLSLRAACTSRDRLDAHNDCAITRKAKEDVRARRRGIAGLTSFIGIRPQLSAVVSFLRMNFDQRTTRS